MALRFQSRASSAVDIGNGITIPQPRILPASLPEDPERTEYQFSIYLNGERVYGIGLFGSDHIINNYNGPREWIFSLDVGRDWVLDSIFDLKKIINNDDDDYYFIENLAKGLVLTYEGRTDNLDNVRYAVTAKPESILARGIKIPNSVQIISKSMSPLPEGEILLAEVFVPAHSLHGE